MNEEERTNFKKLIDAFSMWIKRFEEEGLEWKEQDWINWGIDVTDAIIDMYTYLKSMGVLFNGFNKLLYESKEENEKNVNKKNEDNDHLYS